MEKTLTLNESISNIRIELQNVDIKKSGENKFSKFKYYELSDFLPSLNSLMYKEGINDIIDYDDKFAKLVLIKGEERQEYKIPFKMFEVPLSNAGKPQMQEIQYLGALVTYYKRYLYVNAFGITDGEVIDGMNQEDLKGNKNDKPIKTNNNGGHQIKPNCTMNDFKDYLLKKANNNKDKANELFKKALKELGVAKFEDAMPLKKYIMANTVDKVANSNTKLSDLK